ncbi:helix-turn-helix domain-containing protein [Algoriphagus namhaensis]
MKQPELGKRISELRKAKGLTQEELVEKCNLNVRTIQRIEAGEVTPRSYTVKALFEALDYHWTEEPKKESTTEAKAPSVMFLAIGAGVLYFFISMLEIGFETEYIAGESSISATAFGLLKTGSYVFYVIFLLGWLRLLDYFPNGILKIAIWLMIGGNVLFYGADMVALFTDAFSLGDYYLWKISAFGFLYAVLGIGYISYKQQFSSLALIMGILLVFTGALFFTGIGAFLALIPWTIAEIVQIGLLIYLVQGIGRKSSPSTPLV